MTPTLILCLIGAVGIVACAVYALGREWSRRVRLLRVVKTMETNADKFQGIVRTMPTTDYELIILRCAQALFESAKKEGTTGRRCAWFELDESLQDMYRRHAVAVIAVLPVDEEWRCVGRDDGPTRPKSVADKWRAYFANRKQEQEEKRYEEIEEDERNSP